METEGTSPKQHRMQGEGFPPEPPEHVLNARDQYITAKRAAAKASKTKGEKEQELISAMNEAGIDRLELDGENKFIQIETPEKVAIKTIPKQQRQEREQADK